MVALSLICVSNENSVMWWFNITFEYQWLSTLLSVKVLVKKNLCGVSCACAKVMWRTDACMQFV